MTNNKSFLESVAQDIINRFGTELADVAVVFPNKRASLFLNKHLAQIAKKPVWSPAYITISDLFRKHSELEVADSIELVCRLYSTYCQHVPAGANAAANSLDHFYGWGELLLADFDDIDKNLGNAEKIFSDLGNYQDLTTAPADMLSEEQMAQLKRLFGYFAETQSELKRRFNELWGKLLDIYTDYRQQLRQAGLAYEGMLYRDVAEQPVVDFKYKHYIFVGFNMMQLVEQQLFTRLKNEGKATFYWDFDHYYIDAKNHLPKGEAGVYISKYLTDFPNALDNLDEAIYSNISKPKDITFLSAQTENIQARYIKQWLAENHRAEDSERTAIVLADEKLLPTVVNNLPSGLMINITTGYPLSLSPAASMLNLLLTLRADLLSTNGKSFRLKTVNKLLVHPYSVFISPKVLELKEQLIKDRNYFPTSRDLSVDEGLSLLFAQPADASDTAETMEWVAKVLEYTGKHSSDYEDAFFQESLFRTYTLVNRLNLLITKDILQVHLQTLERLVAQIVGATSVPFHGEPAEGIQVMGVLETRNLDFDHVLFLSCNEGNMPKGVNDSSFIPYSIRKFHGLTTIDNKIAIYAYYFYRLMQRASDISLAYNTTTEGTHTSEMSRFMLQLMVESGHDIKRQSIMAQQSPAKTLQHEVAKDDKVMEKMLKPKEGKETISISPSAIGVYLTCQLKYYYMHVVGLRENDETDDDDIDARIFGNIFHAAADFLYKDYKGRVLQKSDFGNLRKHIDHCVEKAFVSVLYEKDPETTRLGKLNGLQEINSMVIKKYLGKLIEADAKQAPITIIDTEKWVEKMHDINVDGKTIKCKVGGIIDRIDRIENSDTIRIVDYKTGRYPAYWPTSVDDIFDPAKNKDIPANYYIQTMLYSTIVKDTVEDKKVSPALLYIQKMSADDYDPILQINKEPITDIADYRDQYVELLDNLFAEIFNPAIPFAPTADTTRCEHCTFANLCK